MLNDDIYQSKKGVVMETDYETKLRINNLARELLKTGVAASTADAYARAEQILGVKEEQPKETPKLEILPEKKKELLPVAGIDTLHKKYDDNHLIIMKELDVLKSKTNELIIEFKKTNDFMITLRQEILEIRKAQALMHKLQEAGRKPIEEAAQQEPTLQELNAAPQPAQQSQKGSFESGAKSTHPRSGGYSPEDVAIEKFFYTGSKPKE